MAKLLSALLLVLVLVPAAMAQGEGSGPVLDEIRFKGNKVTQEEVLLQEMAVQVGSPYTPEQVETSRQAIMNLGLFKSVETEVLQEQGRNILQLTVDERYYILPLPLLGYRPDFLADETVTNYSYGGQIRFDNLFGLNQRLKIDYEEKKYVDDTEPMEKLTELEYQYPRIVGTPYRLDVDLAIEEKGIYTRDEDETIIANTDFKRSFGRVFVSRWLNRQGASEGWRGGLGMYAERNDYRDLEGLSEYEDNEEIALLGNIGYVMVDQFPYHRQGQTFDYSVSLADEILGSDPEFFRNTLTYRRYKPLDSLDANINTRLKLGLAFGDGEPYSLGSSTSLRGYPSDTLEGKFLLLGNFEYHHHVSGYRQMRGVIFADAGNVWPAVDEINESRVYTSLGVGLRWRVQSFVDVTLRLDYAYNTHTSETETYVSTSGSF